MLVKIFGSGLFGSKYVLCIIFLKEDFVVYRYIEYKYDVKIFVFEYYLLKLCDINFNV